jgi:hypothetical protein
MVLGLHQSKATFRSVLDLSDWTVLKVAFTLLAHARGLWNGQARRIGRLNRGPKYIYIFLPFTFDEANLKTNKKDHGKDNSSSVV